MHRRALRGFGALAVLALVAAACGDDDDDTAAEDEAAEATDEEADGEAAADFRACQVTDVGGVDDRSFNETAFRGLEEAAADFDFEPSITESQSADDYAPNIDALVGEDCNLVITVGFLLGDATAAAAETYPDTQFAIVDFDFADQDTGEDITFDNVRELTFATDEAAFLGGYVAAAMTETGTLGTYGGINIPTVTIFMDGFEAGMNHYNEETGSDVELVGWSAAEQDGLFTGDFENQAAGRATTEQLLDQGADIIMPVAGPVGQGSIEAVRARGGDEKIVWVDTDGCFSLPDECDLFLTSVMKNMDVAVYDTVESAVEGTFEGGLFTGTLENEGVGIAPYNEFEDDVPDEVKDAVDELRQQIIDGELETTPSG
jgi:basic membrane protein A